MIARRKLLIACFAASLGSPRTVFAQRKVYRIGILLSGNAAEPNNVTFTAALGKLGYTEGVNVIFERRFASGKMELLPSLAAELVALKVDLIYVSGTMPAQVAKDATRTIPIVFAAVADPVSAGVVESLARPGGNITGTSLLSPELTPKRLELLRKAFPRVSRLAIVTGRDPANAAQFAEADYAAKSLGMDVLTLGVNGSEDFDAALEQARAWRADSIYVIESPKNFFNRKLLAEFAARTGLPAMFGTRFYAEAGGLLSYGASYDWSYRRAAFYADKILKGAKAGDLPVMQPSQFELVINLKTAKALGIHVSAAVLARADVVIN
jgi:putative ABC transport system substrate-binding protein